MDFLPHTITAHLTLFCFLLLEEEWSQGRKSNLVLYYTKIHKGMTRKSKRMAISYARLYFLVNYLCYLNVVSFSWTYVSYQKKKSFSITSAKKDPNLEEGKGFMTTPPLYFGLESPLTLQESQGSMVPAPSFPRICSDTNSFILSSPMLNRESSWLYGAVPFLIQYHLASHRSLEVEDTSSIFPDLISGKRLWDSGPLYKRLLFFPRELVGPPSVSHGFISHRSYWAQVLMSLTREMMPEFRGELEAALNAGSTKPGTRKATELETHV